MDLDLYLLLFIGTFLISNLKNNKTIIVTHLIKVKIINVNNKNILI